ncbi:hypothetical protein AB0I84_02455 [Streptomyces spectabilis]|uniref:Transmembrane protein n=1 Tax=Streptomyces spectabilis TaxID=68270 RepID=A0A516RBH0_STRST|nr:MULTISPECIES: hypothetical protein [Streptomyces]MBB5108076.1 hypothetical protein [Streptomyces spectabilis]MCI3904302.1 hypothetical protein [Streptomyces spectabilis]QCX78362.1 hypothetical protein C9F11_23725 [Streptomyces sp. YIM 121038]QDQ12993.1 hypothetical protein FH965_22500 [Streptomyces spectabilis]QEV61414.1 hypothetical protein CP982_24150 [Streptomyces spectabilis]
MTYAADDPGTPGGSPDSTDPLDRLRYEQESRRLAEEKKNERMVWWYLAYFLFGIHIVAFVMIYAVSHAK